MPKLIRIFASIVNRLVLGRRIRGDREPPPRPVRVFLANAKSVAHRAGDTEIAPSHLLEAIRAGESILPRCGSRALPFSPRASLLWKEAVQAAGGLKSDAIERLHAVLCITPESHDEPSKN